MVITCGEKFRLESSAILEAAIQSAASASIYQSCFRKKDLKLLPQKRYQNCYFKKRHQNFSL